MARSLSQSLSLRRHLPPKSSSPLFVLRIQSNYYSSHGDNDVTDLPDSADPLVRKLEDAIHRIIVRRSAPDWLPFVPGGSYWVPPPRSGPFGVAQLVEKLVNPLYDEEAMSTRNNRGWPSSAYFIKGASWHPAEDESSSSNVSVSNKEDEDGDGDGDGDEG